MSVNKYRPHILVLPEDDANRKIANGFILHPHLNSRVIQVLPPVGGWQSILDEFKKVYASKMCKFLEERIVFLIDFDQQEDRLSYVEKQIPDNLKKRVFVLGVLSEPEKLKEDINKTFEAIGETLAEECFDDTSELWAHDLLKHNKTERERMISSVKPFLFNQSIVVF